MCRVVGIRGGAVSVGAAGDRAGEFEPLQGSSGAVWDAGSGWPCTGRVPGCPCLPRATPRAPTHTNEARRRTGKAARRLAPASSATRRPLTNSVPRSYERIIGYPLPYLQGSEMIVGDGVSPAKRPRWTPYTTNIWLSGYAKKAQRVPDPVQLSVGRCVVVLEEKSGARHQPRESKNEIEILFTTSCKSC